jgi:hypothetical protein
MSAHNEPSSEKRIKEYIYNIYKYTITLGSSIRIYIPLYLPPDDESVLGEHVTGDFVYTDHCIELDFNK